MKIKRFIGGALESNGYVIYQREGGSCFIIDPGYNGGVFIKLIKEKNLKLKGILLTHHHYDHVGACEKIQAEYDLPVYIHGEDLDIYGRMATPMYDGDFFDVDGEAIRVVHTPGHTNGSVCFFLDKSKEVFTGDTIFNVDLGRTDLEDGNESLMRQSIKNIIDAWSNDVTIYPGHGDSCNMKYVRKVNKEFLDIVEEN